MDKCFQKAMMECSEREKHFTEMPEDGNWVWRSGENFLGVLPQKEGWYWQNHRPIFRADHAPQNL